MREANKETKDRDDFHPMQNINFRLTQFTRNIGYKDKKNNRFAQWDRYSMLQQL